MSGLSHRCPIIFYFPCLGLFSPCSSSFSLSSFFFLLPVPPFSSTVFNYGIIIKGDILVNIHTMYVNDSKVINITKPNLITQCCALPAQQAHNSKILLLYYTVREQAMPRIWCSLQF